MAEEKTKIGSFELNLTTHEKTETGTIKENSPFCVAILGEFSDHSSSEVEGTLASAKRRIIEIDRDNFDDVLKTLKLNLRLPMGPTASAAIDIPIAELDDFHPEQLFENLEIFQKLRDLRLRLQNTHTFNAAAKEIYAWLPDSQTSEPEVTKETGPESDTPVSLLDTVISRSGQQTQSEKTSTGSPLVDELIKEVVARHTLPAPDPRQAELVTAVDQAITAQMRDILHHPKFQKFEAAWRAVYFLVRRLQTGSRLKLYLVDIAKGELGADLAGDDPNTSALSKLLFDSTAGSIPWSLLLGNYTFNASIEDAELLARVARVAQSANISFLAAAGPDLAHSSSFGDQADADDWQQAPSATVQEAWTALRGHPAASHLGLALPRFLLRLPYGKNFSTVEGFDFEEMPTPPSHEDYLWGNAAFAIACLLAQAFEKSGWQMRAGDCHQIDRLPLHYYKEDDETVLKPCAEFILTERGGKIIAQQGLMSLWSIPGSDSIRVSAFRSLAQSGNTIAGAWAPAF